MKKITIPIIGGVSPAMVNELMNVANNATDGWAKYTVFKKSITIKWDYLVEGADATKDKLYDIVEKHGKLRK